MIAKTVRRMRSYLIPALLLVGMVWVAGCGQTEAPEDTDPSALSGTLTIAGSTSVQPFSEALAEEFMAVNPDIQINVQGGGSSVGIESALSGTADIGASSRALKDEERAKANLVDTTIALDGIAVIVNTANEVKSLSTEQIKEIYVGNIKNWNQVGGTNAAISVVSREDGSGTRDAFNELVMDDNDILATALIQNSTGAIRTTVEGDPNAIGYVSLASLNSQVKAVEVDGVAVSEANIKAGTYKIQRPFMFVTVDAPEGLAKAFMDYVLSAAGQQIIAEEGAIGVN